MVLGTDKSQICRVEQQSGSSQAGTNIIAAFYSSLGNLSFAVKTFQLFG